MSLKILTSLLAYVFLSPSLWACLVLDKSSGELELIPALTHALADEKYPNLIPKSFSPYKGDLQKMGLDNRGHWFAVELCPNYEGTLTWVLSSMVSLSETRVFLHKGQKKQEIPSFPLSTAFKQFPLELQGGQTYRVLVSTKSESWQTGLMLLESVAVFFERSTINSWLHGIFNGVLLLTGAFTLILFLIVREKVYLGYFFFIFSLAFWHPSIIDFSLVQFYPSVHWSHYAAITTSEAVVVSFIYFVQQFLSTAISLPRLDRALTIARWAAMAVIVIQWGLPIHISVMLCILVGFTVPVIIMAVAVSAVRQKLPEANILLLAWSGVLFVSIETSSNVFGFPLVPTGVKGHDLLFKSLTLIEITLIAFALGSRYKATRAALSEKQAQLIGLKQHQTEELERTVTERTISLREAVQAKDKFFSIISHDLRGPIGSLSVIFNDVLKSADDLEEDLFKAAQKTTKNTSQLLNDLLSWAHSQTGHLEVKSTYFELRDPIQDMVEFLEPQAHQKQISLKINLAANISVHADSSMISTAIRNILSNAIKFTPDNGVIEVTLENQKGEAVVSVKDSGKGMKPDIVKRLFKLSEKVTSSPDTANNVGSGLGLILCQEFIQKNNGKIGAESELGKGSKFWFSLPIVEPKAQVSQTITLDMSHLKVLVAEDNPLHRETTANSLSKFSVSYDIAEDGAVAIEKAKAGDYDLIFMDIDMPRLNGFEATRQLQQQPNFKTVIVALSSYEQKDLQGRLEGVTFAAFLQKPLEVGKLTEVLLSHF